MPQSWKELALAKKQRQTDAIPKEWQISVSTSVLDVTSFPAESGLLSPKEAEITNTDVDVLLLKLATGTWSSVEVTAAFYKRAIIAHQLTNCLTEIAIEYALSRAVELDGHLKKTGRVVGPLHGLPISLKDQLCIKGIESTIGYVSWIGRYAKRNSVLVDILQAAGGVPFVKTNIPQTLMWPETYNLIFGRTSNPYNRSLTSGGSSGGEGALIALRGSPLGVGSDIGGSVRIPSAFCGLYGLRPSYGRVPYAGAVNSLEGQDSVPSVLGPMCNSITGLKIFMQAVLGQRPWLQDPLAVRKPWDEEGYKLVDHGGGRGLCFAIMWNDGIVVPHPPIIRGLELTRKALLAAGHRVIDWKPIKHHEMQETLAGIWGAAATEDYKATTSPSGEPVISMNIQAEAMEPLSFRPPESGISAYQLWQLQKEKRNLREEYLDHWEKTVELTGTGRPVDAIITPNAPYAAPPHGLNRNADYTTVWNLLDYTALTIPVSKVNQTLDAKKPAHQFLNKNDQLNFELYDPSVFANAPISVQVVGRTLEEEAVIAMSEIVDIAVKALTKGPPAPHL
jgi:amidase